ncbi:hypothetical protein AB0H76_09445 [Nocardia sp. NPDC050712]|uniref:hypothetical protein n=1 Tax=Nocardia sp. NPDC050712 TaxID=3155518 RepID=UPI0033D74574
MTITRTGRMNVLLPQAVQPDVLDTVIRIHVAAALAATGEHALSIEFGPGEQHSPGVTCWPVIYTTGPTQSLPAAGISGSAARESVHR